MGIEVEGILTANSWRANSVPDEGFIENDSSGNFTFGNAGSIGSSIWAHIETKTVGSDTDSLVFSGLDGDAQEVYKLIYRGNEAGTFTNRKYQILPNGVIDSVNQRRFAIEKAAGSGEGTLLSGDDMAFQTGQAHNSGYFAGVLYFWAKSGRTRSYIAQNHHYKPPPDNTINRNLQAWGYWKDTVANVTSLELRETAGNGDGFTIGSTWELFRINRA